MTISNMPDIKFIVWEIVSLRKNLAKEEAIAEFVRISCPSALLPCDSLTYQKCKADLNLLHTIKERTLVEKSNGIVSLRLKVVCLKVCFS